MKRVSKEEYDSFLRGLKTAEEELANIQKYKGEVAIYQGDNWHDNPILYQTEMKENAAIIKVNNLRSEFANMTVIKDRDDSMLTIDEIINPKFIGDESLDESQKNTIHRLQKEFIQKNGKEKLIIKDNNSNAREMMLHRIAYLLCTTNNRINPNDILVVEFGNNDTEEVKNNLESYITDEIEVTDIKNFVSKIANDKINIKKRKGKNILDLFTFQENIAFINNFIKDYYDNLIVSDDLRIDDQVVFNKEEIKAALFRVNQNKPNFDGAKDIFIHKFKSNYDDIETKLREKYARIYRTLPMDNPERKKIIEKSYELSKFLKVNGTKVIKDYFKIINKSSLKIFSIFIENIDRYIGNNSQSVIDYKNETAKMLSKKTLPHDLVYLFMLLDYRINNHSIENNNAILFLDDFKNADENTVLLFNLIFSKLGLNAYTSDNDVNLDLFDDFSKIDFTKDISEKIKKITIN